MKKNGMADPDQLVRENIRNLVPYSSARSEHARWEGIFLDANENTTGDFSTVINGMEPGLNRYPDPLQVQLKEQISRLKGIPSQNIFLGNGSDEAIDLLIRIFCKPGEDRVIICPPAYAMYEVAATINDVGACRVNLDEDFQPVPDAILQAADRRTKILFLCSPNNPTGNMIASHHIVRLLECFPGIIVLDEAYIDFAGKESWLVELNKYPNLVILQTLSKAWAMAGLRIGMAFASGRLISLFNRIKPPYNINAVSQMLAAKSLANEPVKRQWVNEIRNEREWLYNELQSVPSVIRIYPSDANFLLVKFREHLKVYSRLLEKRILVRDRSTYVGCEECLRLTIGIHAENECLIEELKNMCI